MATRSVQRAELVFPDYEIANLPVSGLWNPEKRDIRDLLTGIWNNSMVGITSADSPFGVGDVHRGGTIAITGTAPGTVSFSTSSSYSRRHVNMISNHSTRRWTVAIDGVGNVWLWPDQTLLVTNSVVGWLHSGLTRWMPGLPSHGVTYNVHVDYALGDDANDGLAAGAGGAMKTIAEAAHRIQFLYDGSFNVQLAPGVHDVGSGLSVNSVSLGHDQFTITGDPLFPSLYDIQCDAGGACLSAQDGAIVTVSGVRFKTTGSGSTAVHARQGSTVDTGAVVYHNFPGGTHAHATTWASINVLSDYAIHGGGAFHVLCGENAYVNYGSFVVDIPAATAFTTFLRVLNCGVVSNGGVPMTFTGAGAGGATAGQQYLVANNGVAQIGTTLPGSTAGSTLTGGIYS